MINNLKEIVSRNLVNIPGFRTNRKIVVFESDDWGSIRMPSIEAINYLKKIGIAVDKCHYMLNDILENQFDFERIFEVLTEFKDCKGSHPKITANTIVANPDFDKIRDSNFENYFSELNTSTYSEYYGNSNIKKLIKEGLDLGIYKPQLHGKEHVNISRWMKLLRDNDEISRKAFDLRLFGISGHTFKVKRPSLMAVFDGGKNDIEFDYEKIITDAVIDFENLYGYKSDTFIAPNYVWDDKIENILHQNKVKFIQGAPKQIMPSDSGTSHNFKSNFLGKRNKNGQVYLIRNVNFEPSSNPEKDWVNSSLNEINNAFIWRKPAIINTHRVNFVSGINSINSDNTLVLLKVLLSKIIKKWPDVEFMTSDELGKIIY
jgi:hypothetical protein